MIRTPDDKGVLMLLCRRFMRQPYVELLPSHWYRYHYSELLTADPKSALEEFWGRFKDSGGT